MPKIRAKDNHPLHAKLEKLWNFMDELGISFDIPLSNVFKVQVNDGKKTWNMVDIDNENYSIDHIPPAFEYKLVKEVKDR